MCVFNMYLLLKRLPGQRLELFTSKVENIMTQCERGGHKKGNRNFDY